LSKTTVLGKTRKLSSTLARALLDGKPGDVIRVRTPAGEQELEVVEVSHREIL
jgi:transcription elongation GreA/GreB family factor